MTYSKMIPKIDFQVSKSDEKGIIKLNHLHIIKKSREHMSFGILGIPD